jgi:hypothetical protein
MLLMPKIICCEDGNAVGGLVIARQRYRRCAVKSGEFTGDVSVN